MILSAVQPQYFLLWFLTCLNSKCLKTLKKFIKQWCFLSSWVIPFTCFKDFVTWKIGGFSSCVYSQVQNESQVLEMNTVYNRNEMASASKKHFNHLFWLVSTRNVRYDFCNLSAVNWIGYKFISVSMHGSQWNNSPSLDSIQKDEVTYQCNLGTSENINMPYFGCLKYY